MADITITVNTDNDAFQDGNEEHEVARILRKLAYTFEHEGKEISKWIIDVNGNKVGKIIYEEDNNENK